MDVWKKAAEQDRARDMAATHLDIQNTFSPAWDPIHLGRKPAKEAIAPVSPRPTTSWRKHARNKGTSPAVDQADQLPGVRGQDITGKTPTSVVQQTEGA